jgi:predicted NBD/HSP70 family sugar kinase
MYYGAVEAGGTKFVCAVSNENFEIIGERQEDAVTALRKF